MGKPDAWILPGSLKFLRDNPEGGIAKAYAFEAERLGETTIPLYAIDDETREAILCATVGLKLSHPEPRAAVINKHIDALERLLGHPADKGF